MTVPLIDRGIRCQAVEVAPALHILNPRAFGAVDHDVERMIVVSAVLSSRSMYSSVVITGAVWLFLGHGVDGVGSVDRSSVIIE